jgi:hypothetical protein
MVLCGLPAEGSWPVEAREARRMLGGCDEGSAAGDVAGRLDRQILPIHTEGWPMTVPMPTHNEPQVSLFLHSYEILALGPSRCTRAHMVKMGFFLILAAKVSQSNVIEWT